MLALEAQTHLRRCAMNSGIVSGQSVSPTADLTYFRTQFALCFALTQSASRTQSTATQGSLHDLETENTVFGQVLQMSAQLGTAMDPIPHEPCATSQPGTASVNTSNSHVCRKRIRFARVELLSLKVGGKGTGSIGTVL